MSRLAPRLRKELGAGLPEYVILVVVVALATVFAVSLLGDSTAGLLQRVPPAVSNEAPPPDDGGGGSGGGTGGGGGTGEGGVGPGELNPPTTVFCDPIVDPDCPPG